MNQKALLVIDMQKGIFDDKDFVLEYQEDLFKIVNQAIDQARTQRLPVLFVQHTEKFGLVENSEVWQLDDRLHLQAHDFVFSKTHSDAFWDTQLSDYCLKHSIDELIVCGVQTEYCVDTTIRSAHRLGYKITLISNGHSSVNDGVLTVRQIIDHHNQNLQSFADVKTLGEIDF